MNKIGNRLQKTEGIDPTSVHIDDRFIQTSKGKRKPDVYCEYKGHKIAFEIQLSQLSFRYIRGRCNFYRENEIFLIWILNSFDKDNQGPLEKNIKYLSDYHNLFRLDESCRDFRLICNYKNLYLNLRNQIHQKWVQKPISLAELNFSPINKQVYYYNYNFHKDRLEKEKKERALFLEKERKKQLRIARETQSREKVLEIREKIRKNKDAGIDNYDSIEKEINILSSLEERFLNEVLGWENKKHKGNPLANVWLRDAKYDHYGFLHFVLSCTAINLTINELSQDEKTCLQELYENKKISLPIRPLIEFLFHRGYELTESDEQFIRNSSDDKATIEKELLKLKYFNKLKHRYLTSKIDYTYLPVLCIIESAKQGKIIGSGFKDGHWIAFANNAIHQHHQFGKYIEMAFIEYGLMDQLLSLDKKGTFQSKLNNYRSYFKKSDTTLDALIRALYPKLDKL